MSNETQVQKIMRILKCDEATALDVIEKDKMIDRGERVEFDLDLETEKAMKKLIKSDRKTPTTAVKRERKANNDKRDLISAISKSLEEVGAETEVTNIEREIVFQFNGTKYKIVLSAPRK